MLEIETVSEYQTILETTSKPILIDVYAPWCGPCKAIAPFFAEISEMYKNIEFYKINADEADDLCNVLNVSGLPTFILIKNKKEVKRFSGASRNVLENMIHLALQN